MHRRVNGLRRIKSRGSLRAGRMEKLPALGGSGGLIAIDHEGMSRYRLTPKECIAPGATQAYANHRYLP